MWNAGHSDATFDPGLFRHGPPFRRPVKHEGMGLRRRPIRFLRSADARLRTQFLFLAAASGPTPETFLGVGFCSDSVANRLSVNGWTVHLRRRHLQTRPTRILFRPEDEKLGYLPEGPQQLAGNHISWVNIQESESSTVGSLNRLDLDTGENRSTRLEGRPGFAFPTDKRDWFVVGLERHVALVNAVTGEAQTISDEIDADRSGTIINDGVLIREGIIFGAKELTFSEKKAGLYLFRSRTGELVRLRDDQICSNGKVVLSDDGEVVEFLDIDTPTKSVVRYGLDVRSGELGPGQLALDLTSVDAFPDGMVAAPDRRSVVIAMFNPASVAKGEVREYDLETQSLKTVWEVDGSPQVTCPLLVSSGSSVKIVLTTATENMNDQKRSVHPNAGCLFTGETSFTSVDEPRIFHVA